MLFGTFAGYAFGHDTVIPRSDRGGTRAAGLDQRITGPQQPRRSGAVTGARGECAAPKRSSTHVEKSPDAAHRFWPSPALSSRTTLAQPSRPCIEILGVRDRAFDDRLRR